MAGKDDDKGQYTPEYPNGEEPEPFTFPAQDIYTSWALGAGKNDFFPSKEQQKWVSVLLRLRNISALAFAKGETQAGHKFLGESSSLDDWVTVVQVSNLFLRETGEPSAILYLTALVTEAFFREFLEVRDQAGNPANPELRDTIDAITIGTPSIRRPSTTFFEEDFGETHFFPEMPGEVPEPLDWPDLTGNPPSNDMVIVAIIDDGIPFGHQRFWRTEGDTRIEYAWLQDEEFNDGGGLQGKELTRSNINAAISASTIGGQVDEDFFYQQLGVVNYDGDNHNSVARRVSHGAHIMDAAAGYDYREPVEQTIAAKRPMICVQLPTDVTADTSGTKLEPYLAAAIQYILYRADVIASELDTPTGEIPVVINFSYGHHLGPHDGSNLTVEFIEQQIAARTVPLRVVVPSGNSHLTRTHAVVDFAKKEGGTLKWRLQPDDKTWSFVEIWMPVGVPAGRIKVSVKPPAGSGTPPDGATPPIGEIAGTSAQWPPGSGSDPYQCRVSYRLDNASGRGVFLIEVQPTERLSPSPGDVAELTALSGVWQIKLEKDEPKFAGIVHAWIYRDGPPLGFPIRGRQSYFDHACYQRYDEYGRPVEEDDPDCIIKRAGTINGLGTSDGQMIVVGGYYRKEERPAEYSSGGPTNGSRVGPDVMTASDDSRVHRGQLAAGTRSGSVAALDGTSVSAPQITRWIANELAAGRAGDRDAVKAAASISLGTPERTGEGGVDQADIDGIPIVDFQRYEP